MARKMSEQSTAVFRTVVKTTYLEDVPRTESWGQVDPGGKKDVTYVDIFGPYDDASRSRNYSMRGIHKEVSDGVYPEKDQWGRPHWRAGKPKTKWEKTANQYVEHQVLTPVFAFQPNGTLKLELDWVKL